MPDYRRNRIPGATYFFTVNLRDRQSGLLVTHIDALRGAVRDVRQLLPFRIDAWVVLPDHIHCLWTLPEEDSDFPERWRRIKATFSKSLPDIGQLGLEEPSHEQGAAASRVTHPTKGFGPGSAVTTKSLGSIGV